MGRTSLTRAYGLMSYWSLPMAANPGVASNTTMGTGGNAWFPFRNNTALDTMRNKDQLVYQYLGAMWSTGEVTLTPEITLGHIGAMATSYWIENAGGRADIVLASGTDNQSGLVNGSLKESDASETNLLGTPSSSPRISTGAAASGWQAMATAAAGELCDDLHMGLIVVPRYMTTEIDGDTLLTDPGTHFQGICAGGYSILPLADIESVASGLGSYTTIREITIPFNCRLQSIIYMTETSGAGNALRVRNTTDSEIIHARTMASATPDTGLVSAGDGFTTDSAGRNFTKGEKVALQALTVGTGITGAQVLLVVNSTDHFHTDHRRDLYLSDTSVLPSDTPVDRIYRTTLSGPVSGGWVLFPFTRGDLAASAGVTDMSNFVAPFDMNIEYGMVYSTTTANAPDYIIQNKTQATAIKASAAAPATGTAHQLDPGDFDAPAVSRGDTIALQGDTAAGETLADFTGFLIARVTGHANTHPRWD